MHKKHGKEIKILGIIPARGGSKGIINKNITKLVGKPLIYYTICEAQKSKLLDASIVSTDDPKIAKVAKTYGADVPFLRPKKYAGDLSRDIEYLQHAVNWVQKNRGWKPEIIVMLQPTCPSRTAKDIDDALKFMIKTRCDSVRTVIDPSPYNPFKMLAYKDPAKKTVERLLPKKYKKKLGTEIPRQLLPKYCLPVGLVYATRTKFIKRGVVWGPDLRAYELPAGKFIDIDTPKDLERAKAVMKKYKLL